MKKGLLFITVVSFLISCNSKIVNYLNSSAQFGTFKSYSIVNVKINKRKIAPEATELLGSIERQIKVQMEEKRNYVQSNISPDLILRYELVSNAGTNTNTNSNNTRFSPYNPNTTISTRVIYESVILLELFNGKTLVWQGSYDLNQSRKDGKNEKAIQKAIDQIFTTYPYKAGQLNPDPSLTTNSKK